MSIKKYIYIYCPHRTEGMLAKVLLPKSDFSPNKNSDDERVFFLYRYSVNFRNSFFSICFYMYLKFVLLFFYIFFWGWESWKLMSFLNFLDHVVSIGASLVVSKSSSLDVKSWFWRISFAYKTFGFVLFKIYFTILKIS